MPGEKVDLDSLLITLRNNINIELWYQFGVEIGVPIEFLDSLYGYPDNECMIEVADHWLRNHPDTPTWTEIEDASRKFQSSQFDIYLPGKLTECKE